MHPAPNNLQNANAFRTLTVVPWSSLL